MDLNQQLIFDFVNGEGVFAVEDGKMLPEDAKDYRVLVGLAREHHTAAKTETDTVERQRLIDTVDKNLMAANEIRIKNGLGPIGTTPARELTAAEQEREDDQTVNEMLALVGDPAAVKGGAI